MRPATSRRARKKRHCAVPASDCECSQTRPIYLFERSLEQIITETRLVFPIGTRHAALNRFGEAPSSRVFHSGSRCPAWSEGTDRPLENTARAQGLYRQTPARRPMKSSR